MRTVGAIAVGAALGGVARYYLATAMHARFGGLFPWGTLLVNVSGSLLLGFIIHYALATPTVSAEMRAFLTTGFCGGYTTFSAFSYETVVLMEEGRYERALVYVVTSVLLAAVATLCGLVLARELVAMRPAAR